MKYDRPGKAEKPCLFCGQPGQVQRTLNLVTVDLCNDDYYNHSLGEVAAQIRNRARNESINNQVIKAAKTRKRKRRLKRQKELKHGPHPHP